MKCVMLSIRPKWCEKIVSGEKTIEVRKTAPKEVPFKAYIYCSYGNDKENYMLGGFGKVIGEFICDKVDKYNKYGGSWGRPFYNVRKDTLKAMGLNHEELLEYGNGKDYGFYLKTLYGWHISNLKIYDKPKELSEFVVKCESASEIHCRGCKNNHGE